MADVKSRGWDGELEHAPSEVCVSWSRRSGYYVLKFGGVEFDYDRRWDGDRIMAAVVTCLATRADAKRLPLDETAKQLARAVLDANGADAAGCAALADRVKELLGS